MSDATIYALCAPRDGAIKYVGCTRYEPERRLRRHINRAKHDGRTPKDAWIRSLLCAELRPTVRVLEVVPVEDMYASERRWLASLSDHGLLNATRGGPGMTGYSPSAETRAKLHAALVGRRLSSETRAKMSAARTGVPRGPFSEEHRAALSAAQRRRFADPAERERIGARARGRRPSAETRGVEAHAVCHDRVELEFGVRQVGGQRDDGDVVVSWGHHHAELP